MAGFYKDFLCQKGTYQKAEELTNENAVVLAVRNILLSKPGNFPFNPEIGMDIKKYQFELLDDHTVATIKNELQKQLGKYIPSSTGVSAEVLTIEKDDKTYLGISIGINTNGEDITANFLLSQDEDTVYVFNEIK